VFIEGITLSRITQAAQKEAVDQKRRNVGRAFNNFEDGLKDLQQSHKRGPATDVRWDPQLNKFVMVYGEAT
jgi:hypothetical protein